MFDFFKRRKSGTLKKEKMENHIGCMVGNCNSNNVIEIPFEKKIIVGQNRDNILVNEWWYPIVKKMHDESSVKGCIKSIEIKQGLNCAGQCVIDVCGDSLEIKIQLGAHKISEGNVFTETLAHELFHAEDAYNIVDKYGILEYQAIKENSLAKMTRDILGEYSACRKTAEMYNSFDSVEDVKARIENTYTTLEATFKGQYSNYEFAKSCIYCLNYAIATRCAFADVSENEEVGLIFKHNTLKYEGYKEYISKVRKLLNDKYGDQPLNASMYIELGNQIICELAKVHGAEGDMELLMSNLF